MPVRRLLSIALCLLTLASASVVHADGAPMWESPEGLTPGMPNTQVQMTAEEVKVAVSQKPDGVYASVSAVFDLQNHGSATQMLTGFPDLANAVLGQGNSYSPVSFTPANISNFKAWTDAETFQPSEQTVGTGQFAGPWFVWNMSYPAQKSVRLNVSYEQRLEQAGDYQQTRVPVSYVLRTGALWNGTIGHAVVTMTAPDGGSLLAPVATTLPNRYQASVFAPSNNDNGQLIWTLDNAKPTQDVDAEFIRPDTVQALQAAEAAASVPGATPAALANSSEVVMNVFGRDLAGVYGTHYYPLVEDWTQRALAGDQSDASVWEAVGDLASNLAPRGVSFLRCMPGEMQNAYQQAAALGSTTAAQKLQDINVDQPGLPMCPSADSSATDSSQASTDSGQPPAAAASTDTGMVPDTLTDDERAAILSAVDRANAAWSVANQSLDPSGLSAGVAGQELSDDLAELNTLRSQGHTEKNTNTAFTVTDVTLDSPGHAIVHTQETWSDEIHDAASGRLVQQSPPVSYHETYTLEYQNGGWIVTKNDLH
jgi:hypothetical protein